MLDPLEDYEPDYLFFNSSKIGKLLSNISPGWFSNCLTKVSYGDFPIPAMDINPCIFVLDAAAAPIKAPSL